MRKDKFKYTKKYTEEQEKQKQYAVEIMREYHNQDPDEEKRALKKQDACLKMLNLLDTVVEQIIHISHGEYAKKYGEDMRQEAKCEIIHAMSMYDPENTMPSTYFAPFIRGALNRYESTYIHKRSPHYNDMIIKIKKCMETLEKKNIPYTPQIISDLTEIPMTTVERSIERMRATESQGTFNDEVLNKPSDAPNPETAYLEEEKKRLVWYALAHIPKKEAEVLEMYIMSDKSVAGPKGFHAQKYTYREVGEALGCSAEDVKVLCTKGKRHVEEILLRKGYKSESKGQAQVELNDGEIPLVPDTDLKTYLSEGPDVDFSGVLDDGDDSDEISCVI